MLQFCSVSHRQTFQIKWEVYFSKRLCRTLVLCSCYDFACICVCIVGQDGSHTTLTYFEAAVKHMSHYAIFVLFHQHYRLLFLCNCFRFFCKHKISHYSEGMPVVYIYIYIYIYICECVCVCVYVCVCVCVCVFVTEIKWGKTIPERSKYSQGVNIFPVIISYGPFPVVVSST